MSQIQMLVLHFGFVLLLPLLGQNRNKLMQQHMLTTNTIMTNVWTLSSSSKSAWPLHSSLMSEYANENENTYM